MQAQTDNSMANRSSAPAMKDPNELIPIDVGARECGLSHWTVRRYLSDGILRRYKVAGTGRARRTLVRRGDLMNLIRVAE